MRTSLFFVAITLILGACRPDETIAPASAEQLAGEWRLVEPASSVGVTLRLTRQMPLATEFTAAIRFQVDGQSTVNRYLSGLAISNATSRSVSVEPINSTKMAGAPEAMQFEQTYFANLKNVNRYELTNTNRLRLYYEGAKPGVLVYEKIN